MHSNEPYFAVQALGPSSQRARHLRRLSHAAPSHDLRWLGVGAGERLRCRTGELRRDRSPCLVAATITAGRTVIAHTHNEYIAGTGAGEVFFQLSGAGARCSRTLAAGRLPVRVTVRGSSGTTAGATLDLVPFNATGAGPPRSLAQSSTLRIIGTDGYVSADGVGSILAQCVSFTPCHVTHHAVDRIDGHRPHRQRVRRRQRAGLPELHPHRGRPRGDHAKRQARQSARRAPRAQSTPPPRRVATSRSFRSNDTRRGAAAIKRRRPVPRSGLSLLIRAEVHERRDQLAHVRCHGDRVVTRERVDLERVVCRL